MTQKDRHGKFWMKLSQVILRNRAIIMVALLGITVVLGYFAFTQLKLDNRFGQMLPKDSPAQRDYLHFHEIFHTDENMLVVAARTENLYDLKTFQDWYELGDTVRKLPGVDSVLSEAHMFKLVKGQKARFTHPETGEPVVTERFVDDTTYNRNDKALADYRALTVAHPDLALDTVRCFVMVKVAHRRPESQQEVDSLKQEVRNLRMYDRILYNDSTDLTLMMVVMNEEFLADLKKSKVVDDIETLVRSYEKDFDEFHFSGLPYIRITIGKRVIEETYLFVGLAIGVTSLLLWLFFRSIRIMIICNMVVAIAVIWSLGSIAALGYEVSILMALVPPLMIVIGIPNCIFLVNKFHQEIRLHGNKVKALSRVVQKIGNATFMTNLTTALGFSTFIFTNSVRLTQFGVIASLNILCVFLLSITIIPIMFSLFSRPKERHTKHLEASLVNKFVEALVKLASSHRRIVFAVAGVVLGLSIFGMTQMESTGNITGDLPKDDPVLTDLKAIEHGFGGVIPYDILVDTKRPERALSQPTLKKLERIQDVLAADSVFSRSLSIADGAKTFFSAYYNNNPEKYALFDQMGSREKNIIRYIERTGEGADMSMFLDSTKSITRIALQIADTGSYEIAEITTKLYPRIDSILNPNQSSIDSLYRAYTEKEDDSALFRMLESNSVLWSILAEKMAQNEVGKVITSEDSAALESKEMEYSYDFDLVLAARGDNFNDILKEAIDEHQMKATITGTAVVAAEGTQYLVYNLLLSLAIAVVLIAILMALLFRSWRMVVVSLIPNFLPLLFTAGFMGFTGIPIKPSTILVFSIAFGISVDDTIHFLAKYRMELKQRPYDLAGCVISALRETGVSMFYTSIVLFFGFSMFVFSQFGGTKALGLLVSLTLLVAMFTNLILLPSLLLALHQRVTTKAFREPLIELYDEEEDIDFDELEIYSSEEEDDDDDDDG